MAQPRKVLFALVVFLALVAAPLRAQTNSAAIAALAPGDIFAGFVGPFRATQTGIDFSYVVLCYNLTTRIKVVTQAIVSIPDGTTAAQVATITTSGVIAACGDLGFTAAPATVFLPVFQRGS